MEYDKLPVWLQVAAFLGTLVAASVAGFFGWKREGKSEKGVPSKDAVVLSAAIADSNAIHDLATSIRSLIEYLRSRAGADADMRDDIKRTLGNIEDVLHRMSTTLRDIDDTNRRRH